MKFLCVIQARLESSRFPGKVMQLVNGRTMVKRVWDAAKGSKADKVVVLWPERYPDLEMDDLHSKFGRLINEFKPTFIIRLTADCPLITSAHIDRAIELFERDLLRYFPYTLEYFNNRLDGYDVQIFTLGYMNSHYHKQNVIDDIPNVGGDSVNTPADLERIRRLAQ